MDGQNLPCYTIPLVGQIDELRSILTRLHDPDCRLVTIVGQGGIGKTRLAVELIHSENIAFLDGIFFVAMDRLSSPNEVPSAIASSLGYKFVNGNTQTSELLNYLSKKQLLLVLDNFEHLLSARKFVTAILHQTTGIKILITSREPLKLHTEWVYQIHGLAYPPQSVQSSDEIMTYDSVNFFIEHAQRVSNDFSHDREINDIAEICRVTEGMPLALELAATWLRVLSCADIADEIQKGIDILRSRVYDIAPRHRSIRAVFDHSWNLLSAQEKSVMMGLSVFQGGFRYQAATEITDVSLDDLAVLVDKSLIRTQQNGRFTLHQLQRQYALQRLNCQLKHRLQIRDQHCTYFARYMNIQDFQLLGNDNTMILKRIDEDIANIRLAWSWALTNRRIDDIHKMVHPLYYYTWFRADYHKGLAALHDAVKMLRMNDTEAFKIVLGHVLSHLAAMHIWSHQEQDDALKYAEESVTILRSVKAQKELAVAIGVLGWVHLTSMRWDAAKQCLQESFAQLENTDQEEFRAFVIELLGKHALDSGQYSEAQDWFEQSLSLGVKQQDNRTVTSAFLSLGKIALINGDYDNANLLLSQGLQLSKKHDLLAMMIVSPHLLGEVAQAKGDLTEATDYFMDSLTIATQYDKLESIIRSLISLGNTELERNDLISAQYYFDRAQTYLFGKDDKQNLLMMHVGLGDLALAQGHDGDALQRYSVALDIFHKVAHIRLDTYILTQLGLVKLIQGDLSSSYEFFSQALSKELYQGTAPTLLYTMAGVANLWLEIGNFLGANELALVICNHSASHSKSKRLARQILSQSEIERLDVDHMETAQYNGEVEILEISKDLLRQLNDPLVKMYHPLIEPLSKREKEVLQLIANGKTNREISQVLIITVGTVKSHVHHILQKLDVGNRTEAIARARHLSIL